MNANVEAVAADGRNQHGASGYLPLVGRAGLAAIFVLSGASKIADPGSTIGYIASVGLPFPELGLAIAVLVEIVGGALLVAGYRLRATAGVLAAFSIATAVFFHGQFGDQNQLIHFLKNIALAGGLLQVVAFGGGSPNLSAKR